MEMKNEGRKRGWVRWWKETFLFGDDIDVMWHNAKLIWYSKVQFKIFQTFQFEVTQWLKSVP